MLALLLVVAALGAAPQRTWDPATGTWKEINRGSTPSGPGTTPTISPYQLPTIGAQSLGGVRGTGVSTLCGASEVARGFHPTTGALQCTTSAESDPQVGTLDSGKWCTSNGSRIDCAQSPPLTSIAGGVCGVDEYLVSINSTGTATCGTRKIGEDTYGSVKGRGRYLGTTCGAGEVMYGFNSSVPEADPGYGRMVCVNPFENRGCSEPNLLRAFDSHGEPVCIAAPAGPANCSAGYVETGNGTSHSCTNTIANASWAATADEAAFALSADVADALHTNGSNCSAGQVALGVDTQGNAEGCWTPFGTLTSGKMCTSNGTTVACTSTIPASPASCSAGYVETGNGTSHSCTNTISTATSLASDGTNCSSGQAPLGVDASGNAQGCFSVLTSFTETDPYVDTVSSSGDNWCRGNASSHVQCTYAAPAVGSITGGDCPNGQFMYGMNTNGTPKCRAVIIPWSCTGCGGGSATW